jgi:hypothetical protein
MAEWVGQLRNSIELFQISQQNNTQSVRLEGTLEKRIGVAPPFRWKRKWFVLHDSVLWHRNAVDSDFAKRAIQLHANHTIRPLGIGADKVRSRAHTFTHTTITTP